MSISSRLLPSAVAGALLVALAGCGSGARPDPTLTQAPAATRPTAAAGNVVLPAGSEQVWQPLRGRGFKSSNSDGVGIGDRGTDSSPFNSNLEAYLRNEDASSGGDLDFFLLWALDRASEGGADLDDDGTPDAAPVFVAPGTEKLRDDTVIADDGDNVVGEEEADWLARKGRETGVAGVDSEPLNIGAPEVGGHGEVAWLRSIETSGTGSFGWDAIGDRLWRDADGNPTNYLHAGIADSEGNPLRFFNSEGTGAGQDGSGADKVRSGDKEAFRLYVKHDGKVMLYLDGQEREIADKKVTGLSDDENVDLVLETGTAASRRVQAVRHGSRSWTIVEGYEAEEEASVNSDGHLVIDGEIQIALGTQGDTDPDSTNPGTLHLGADGGLRLDGDEIAPASSGPFSLNDENFVVDKNDRVLVAGLEANENVQISDGSSNVEATAGPGEGLVYHESVDDDLAASVAAEWFINDSGYVVAFFGGERLVATGSTAADAAAGRGFVASEDGSLAKIFDVVDGNTLFQADIAAYNADSTETIATGPDDNPIRYYVTSDNLLANERGAPIDKDGAEITDPEVPEETLTTTPVAGQPIRVDPEKHIKKARPIRGVPLRSSERVGEGRDANYLYSVALTAADGDIILASDLDTTERKNAGITLSRNDSTLIHYNVDVLHPFIEGSDWSLQYSNFTLVRASRKDTGGQSLTGANAAPDYFLNAFTFVRKDHRTPGDWFEANDGATNNVELTYNTRLAGWGRSAAVGAGADDDIFLLTGDGDLTANFGRNGGGTVSGAFETSIYETKAEAGSQFRDGRDWRKIRMDDVKITEKGGYLQFHGGLTVDSAVSDAGDGAGADKGESAAYTGRVNGVFAGPVAEEIVGDFTLTTPTAAAPDFLGGVVGESYEAPERATDSAN